MKMVETALSYQPWVCQVSRHLSRFLRLNVTCLASKRMCTYQATVILIFSSNSLCPPGAHRPDRSGYSKSIRAEGTWPYIVRRAIPLDSVQMGVKHTAVLQYYASTGRDYSLQPATLDLSHDLQLYILVA